MERRCEVKETIKETSIQGLSIITAGELFAEPTLIMNQARLKEIFEELKFYFDFIVVDVPPVIPVSDPVIIASEVDGTLIVVRAGSTPKEVVKRAVNFLNNSKVNILGVVMNNLDEVLPYYYSPKYYSYEYYDNNNQQAKT